MDLKWDQGPTQFHENEPQRDFLAEATNLALQLDPVSWDFDLSDRDVNEDAKLCKKQQLYFNNTALATGTVMRDKVTQMGTQSMCALYKPESSPLQVDNQQNEPQLQPESETMEGKSPSHTGSEPDWENDIPCLKPSKGHVLDQQSLKVRDRGKSVQRRWRQKFKDKAEEQRRRSESLQHKLEEMSKEKAAVEAHADLLEKALMKLSVDNSKPQSQHSESDLQTQVRSPFSEETCKEVEGLEVADWGRTKENFTAAYQPQAHSTHAARTWRVYIEGQADLYSHLQVVEGPAFVPSQGWTTFDPRGSVVLSAVFDHPKTLKPEEAATIPLRDYARLWTEYVVKSRECLQKADLALGPDCPHLNKLKALLDERHGFLSWTSANNLPMCHRLNSSNLESERPLKAKHVSPKSFNLVLDKLKLTEEQKRVLVESRNNYLLNIGFHSASLARLQSQLMALDPSPRESLRNSPYLQWTELSRALQESVEEIHLTYVRLHFDIYHGEQALTAYQAGILLVECFPYIPDLIMLMRELAISQSAPSSHELLTKGAMRYAEKHGAEDIQISSEPYKPVVDKVGDLISKVQLWDNSAGVS